MIVARDLAHAKLRERLEQGQGLPDYFKNHPVYYAGPAKTPEGYASGAFGPTTAGRMDSFVADFQAAGGSMVMLAKGNRSPAVREACKKHGGFYLASIGGAAANLAEHCIKKVETVEYPELGMEAIWRIEVEDFPAFIVIDDKGNDFFKELNSGVSAHVTARLHVAQRRGPAGLARHGPAGARRRLRSGNLCAQPRADRHAPPRGERTGAGHPRAAAARRLRAERIRSARYLSRPTCPASGRQGGAPINVFVHGGAWRRNKAADYALQAEPLVRAGAHAVIIDFINVDQAGGDLLPMYEQVRRALAWVWRNAESFGGDRDRLYISAHSSGSHLAACVLTHGWREEELPENFCKGALLLSGMYDLKPVRLSKRSAYVKFTDAMEQTAQPAASPRRTAYAAHPRARHLRDAGVPAPDADFFAAVQAAGKPAALIVGEAYNHFELLETLANPYGLTGRAMLRQMGLAAPAVNSSSSALHVEQFDIEHQRGVRRYDAAGAARAIAELGRDDESALAANLHGGDALIPAGDDLMFAEGELERLVAVDRAVELLALDAVLIKPAGIVHDADLAGPGGRAGADFGVREFASPMLWS